MSDKHAAEDPEEMGAIRDRWIGRRNRDPGKPEYRAEWYGEQCGFCRYWFPMVGKLGLDYGACANGKSEFDGAVRFEHDGCEVFEHSGRWSIPSDF
ncbi:DUF3027 domain-containing protein [Streptomyces sp. Y1]|uniref:DUF3027 domain-containing protein n=1 Tax=Streptomyces sp. Y1 TaxID=3238634 RepID=A0AB39TWH5_9ACTN